MPRKPAPTRSQIIRAHARAHRTARAENALEEITEQIDNGRLVSLVGDHPEVLAALVKLSDVMYAAIDADDELMDKALTNARTLPAVPTRRTK